MTDDEREARLVVSADGVDDVIVTIKQEAGDDIPQNMYAAHGTYYGSAIYGRGNCYEINLYDFLDADTGGISMATSMQFSLHIFAEEPDPDASTIELPEGTYTFAPYSEDGMDEFTAISDFSLMTAVKLFAAEKTLSVEQGTFTVEKDGNNTVIKFKEVELSDGSLFSGMFYGDLAIKPCLRYSTFDGDFDFGTISNDGVLFFGGDAIGNGTYAWSAGLCGEGLFIDEQGTFSGTGCAVLFEIFSDTSSTRMIPAGTYSINRSFGPFTARPGGNPLNDTIGWYLNVVNGATSPVYGWAPLMYGEITISHTGDVYTIEYDAVDDAGNRITGTYNGTIPLTI